MGINGTCPLRPEHAVAKHHLLGTVVLGRVRDRQVVPSETRGETRKKVTSATPSAVRWVGCSPRP